MIPPDMALSFIILLTCLLNPVYVDAQITDGPLDQSTDDITYRSTDAGGGANMTVMESFQVLRSLMGDRLALRQKVPPKYYHSHSSSIAISFEPLQITNVEGMSQAVTLSSIVTLTWHDPEVTWTPSAYSGIKDIQLASDNFWTPSVIVPKSTVGTDLNLPFPETVDVTYRGYITAFIPTMVSTLCNLDMTYFPFDAHNCSIVFIEESLYNMTFFSLPATDITLHFGTDGEWFMERHGCFSTISHFSPNFEYVVCSLSMRRRSLFFVVNLLAPMAMTSVMTLMVFLIPAEGGEKIGFVLSMYTSTSVFLSYIVERIPKNMDKTLPRVNILLLAIVVQVIVATGATVLVLHRYKVLLVKGKESLLAEHAPEKIRSPPEKIIQKNNNGQQCENPSKSDGRKERSGLQNSNNAGNKASDFNNDVFIVNDISKVSRAKDTNRRDQHHQLPQHRQQRQQQQQRKCGNGKDNEDLQTDENDCKNDRVNASMENEVTQRANQCEGSRNETVVSARTGEDRCLTHNELDKIFFWVLSFLTALIYAVVYVY